MNALHLEDDVFEHIMSNVASTGLSPSAYLRNELRLVQPPQVATTNGPTLEGGEDGSGLVHLLASPRFKAQRTAVKRFLMILSFLYKEEPEKFERASRSVTGRSRKYFGMAEHELSQSGTQVNPKSIPDTPFWVVTNNSTNMKRDILKSLMRAMGYSDSDIRGALNSL